MKKEEVQKTVRERYGKIAKESNSGCCGGSSETLKISPCCGNSSAAAKSISKQIGYTDADINAVPEGANLGLGCGNPIALASLKKGEIIVSVGRTTQPYPCPQILESYCSFHLYVTQYSNGM